MWTWTFSPSIIGVFLMVFAYREGNNGEEKFNELTMANLEAGSTRYVHEEETKRTTHQGMEDTIYCCCRCTKQDVTRYARLV